MAFDDLWNDRIGPLTSTLPTFGSDGKLLGNVSSSQGATPNIRLDQDLPNVGGVASLNGIPQAASAAGIQGAGIPPSATTGSVSATTGGSASDWFTRAVVVILGFIFVAVGLTQFKQSVISLVK